MTGRQPPKSVSEVRISSQMHLRFQLMMSHPASSGLSFGLAGIVIYYLVN